MVITDASAVMAVIRASRPTFRNEEDKIVFAIHATFMASGFYLNATGDHVFDDIDTFVYPASNDEVGIDHWNSSEGHYAFMYSNPGQSPRKVKVLCFVGGPKIVAIAMRHAERTVNELSLKVQDYVENGGNDYPSQYKNFEMLVERIKDVVEDMVSTAIESSNRPSSSEEVGHDADQGQGLNQLTYYQYQYPYHLLGDSAHSYSGLYSAPPYPSPYWSPTFHDTYSALAYPNTNSVPPFFAHYEVCPDTSIWRMGTFHRRTTMSLPRRFFSLSLPPRNTNHDGERRNDLGPSYSGA